ncbi:hypothetical protein L1049_023926 [Liquidambar formosana]|uniref:BZIP domain-containing protein n=1 Tax=Liquidambar formosana TaxID=63359 RepID=A0AAP0S0C5_LIQFO
MLSTFPAMLPSETMFGNPFPPCDGGFPPWDFQELMSIIPSQNLVTVKSNSDDPTHNPPNFNSNSSGDGNPSGSVIDERKRRRMISNRESARRSRMRKQKHLENLRNQANRLRIQNRDLRNRLRLVLYHCHVERNYNEQLQSEYSTLQKRLAGIRQIMYLRELQHFSPAWPCNITTTPITSVNEQTTSLITQS